ncbi:hypothetical protein [Niveispirillum irakense]|uniref:hypothetical protein n=1 Tax=Niveispirillum irakense TaxID=34011 RepID=UPI0012B50902|nr:hypothetical protein [Niveispirillum irakense]
MRSFMILLIALTLTAQKVEACDIRGDQVQVTSLDEFETKHGKNMLCSDRDYAEFPVLKKLARDDIGEVWCVERSMLSAGEAGTIANIKAKTYYIFFNKKLISIASSFSSSDFNQMKTSFIQKWGEPSTNTTEVYSNGFGAVFKGEQLSWAKDSCTIALSQYGKKIDESVVGITSFMMEEYLNAKKKTPKPSPDL